MVEQKAEQTFKTNLIVNNIILNNHKFKQKLNKQKHKFEHT